MTIEIVENQFNEFFEVPFKIYPTDFPFVSEFKDDLKRFLSIKNPLFKSDNDFKYYVAKIDGKLVGRLTAHIHHESNQIYNQKKCYFGYFDVINNIEVATALLKKVEDFARSHNCTDVVGNFNLTAMQKAGVLTRFHLMEQYTDQIINPLYLPTLLEIAGYKSTFPMSTYMSDVADINTESIQSEKVQSILKNPDYSFDHMDKKNLPEIIETMRICLNGGFATNPLFVPLTSEEIQFQAKDLTLILDIKISVVCRYKGNPIGAIVCLPNINPFLKKTKSRLGLMTLFYFIQQKMKTEQAILVFYSVLKEHQSQGINTVMFNMLVKNLKERKYKSLAGTWVANNNIASKKIVEKFNGKLMHELCLYEKSLK